MSKHLFASEDVMEEYLTALLTEEQKSEPKEAKPTITIEADAEEPEVGSAKPKAVSELLAEANQRFHQESIETEQEEPELPQPVVEPLVVTEPEIAEPEIKVTTADKVSVETAAEVEAIQTPPPPTGEIPEAYLEGDFQALYFKVAGLTVAVPLTELGGIHNIDKPNPLFGKPNWFMGVMLHREEKLNVVDTARWVMPEKYDEVGDDLDYQYVIMLGDSQWGLACETLVNTLTLTQDDVKWRAGEGKRPWLAGLVKEKMCALLNVEQLIQLLDAGLGS